MVGKITVSGSGEITPEDDGALSTWTVNEAITPVAIGQSTAATGNLSFTGVRDETDGHFSEWAVAEAATFTHQDDGAGALGDLEGNIASVTAVGTVASGSMATILQQLSAERTMPTQGTYTTFNGAVLPNLDDGNYPVSAALSSPADIAFDSAGNMFVFDVSNFRIVKFVYTSGAWYYSAATAAIGNTPSSADGDFGSGSAPRATLAVDSSDRIYATDPGNTRVQRFSNSLAYQTKFGTSGAGDGQFGAGGPGGIAIDASGNIYVSDHGNRRVQKFNSSHTFVAKWGSSGSGDGQFGIGLSRMTFDSTGSLLVVDSQVTSSEVPRVQVFDSAGNFLESFTSPLPPIDGSTLAGIRVSSDGSIYLMTSSVGKVIRFLPDYSYDGIVGSYGSDPGQIAHIKGGIWISPSGGLFITEYEDNSVVWLTLGGNFTQPLSTYFQQYVDLCLTGHVIDYAASSDPNVIYQGWTDNVWTKLNELCAATGTELAVVGGIITIRDVGITEVDPELFTGGSIAVDTVNLARAVDIVYQNVDYGDGVVMYDAFEDDNRIFQISAGKAETFTLVTNSYPVVVNSPVPTDDFLISAGQYHVTGADDLPVVAQEWLDYGGSVSVALGDNPNEIDVTLTGPTEEIPGVPGPYTLAASDGSSDYATLSITGSGVTTNPQTLHLYTGADPALVTQETQTTITNVHITDEAAAYSRGVWASDLACGPNVTLTGILALEACSGFGLTSGAILPYADSRYRILTTAIVNSDLTITATRHVTAGDEYDVWSALAELTNLSQNPSFETNLTGFTASASTTITQSATWASSGTNSMRISTTDTDGRALIGNASGAGFGGSIPWALQPGETYTLTADVHSVQPGGGSWLSDAGVIEITYGTSAANNIPLVASSPLPFPTTDATVSVTFTIPTNAEGLQIALYATGVGASWFAYWDAIIVTEGETEWPFFDGSFSGASWAGTTNLSAASRVPDTAGDYAAYWNGEPAKNAIIRPLRHP
jgi:sugar lactone lactonase YvrE